MTERFVGVRTSRFRALVERHRLGPTEAWILTALVYECDHRTGVWAGTQADLAEVVGLYRKNVASRLKPLEDAGLIECYFPRGHTGRVTVLVYCEVVHLPPSQEANHPLYKGQLGTKRTEGHKGQTTPNEEANHPLRANGSAGHSVAPSGLNGADVIPFDSRARGSGQEPPATANSRGACPDPTLPPAGGEATLPRTPPVAQRRAASPPSSREWLRDPRARPTGEVIHRGQA